MVSNLQRNPYVTITNKTPYATFPTFPPKDGDHDTIVMYVAQSCSSPSPDRKWGVIASGDTWATGSKACLVKMIYTALTTPDPDSPDAPDYHPSYPNRKERVRTLTCRKYYYSSGTSYSQFSIIMDGDDACCVVSSHETQKC